MQNSGEKAAVGSFLSFQTLAAVHWASSIKIIAVLTLTGQDFSQTRAKVSGHRGLLQPQVGATSLGEIQGADLDALARLNDSTWARCLSGSAAHVLPANMFNQPLLRCQEAGATPGHCSLICSGRDLCMGISNNSRWALDGHCSLQPLAIDITLGGC